MLRRLLLMQSRIVKQLKWFFLCYFWTNPLQIIQCPLSPCLLQVFLFLPVTCPIKQKCPESCHRAHQLHRFSSYKPFQFDSAQAQRKSEFRGAKGDSCASISTGNSAGSEPGDITASLPEAHTNISCPICRDLQPAHGKHAIRLSNKTKTENRIAK